MRKPEVIEIVNDNGSHSHWALVDVDTGDKLWSEDPEECEEMGYPVSKQSLKENSNKGNMKRSKNCDNQGLPPPSPHPR